MFSFSGRARGKRSDKEPGEEGGGERMLERGNEGDEEEEVLAERRLRCNRRIRGDAGDALDCVMLEREDELGGKESKRSLRWNRGLRGSDIITSVVDPRVDLSNTASTDV